jgi:hypothetical protein
VYDERGLSALSGSHAEIARFEPRG